MTFTKMFLPMLKSVPFVSLKLVSVNSFKLAESKDVVAVAVADNLEHVSADLDVFGIHINVVPAPVGPHCAVGCVASRADKPCGLDVEKDVDLEFIGKSSIQL
eukprot:CAMPEP_0204899552 /NCGR_PEP_ID=MMETSP1397-20131031/1920_1 /ASSEMBLY_ACC=CAM_ASM_000891 /TAXON_ID=49980 /ORGANISM="Climacostomum Climacostomum virens, Strain Stock W-24" /LENGTH=102 /DNA_ID=CAMNT_0052067525 /DNA_START=421 /DNA_END=729 /DNA_ORIENTATION=+